ncbi:MAG TPA: MBL fold metallo-hydrolase [Cytophagales bacterium]|nr:MBL fold metallo-hydrolase [Cytophagales bacterium]HAA20861.1 MBL fold metallo-hydrolase [Cytophagales bacterium]HAP59151.1 MBL fold metallo-hydrolase [Cytophagales bacterium]
MQLQLIRNATLKLTYAGKTLLVDPMLGAKGSLPSFGGVAPNPVVELPMPVEEVLDGVDAVLVTHRHGDHFDPAAMDLLSKDLPLFCQPPEEDLMQEKGFMAAQVVHEGVYWEGITITRTGGKHGSGAILEAMGPVSGFVLKAEGEPTVYIVGDSIWTDEVSDALTQHRPEVVVLNSGGAIIPGHEQNPILMDEQEVMTVAQQAPWATLVAIHMEALDHCHVTRDSLRDAADQASVAAEKLRIPEDGEVVTI